MSDSDRRDLSSNLVLVTAVVMLAALVIMGVAGISAQNAYRIAAGEDRAERYNACRQSSERSPVPFLFDSCSPTEARAGDDGKTAEYDLAAQNRMADWAALVAVLSLAGLLVSGVGVWLVYSTLKAAQDTLKAERAWITSAGCVPVEMHDCELDGTNYPFVLGFMHFFQNDGRSPATNITSFFKKQIVGVGDPIPVFEVDIDVGQDMGILGVQHPVHTGPIGLHPHELADCEAKKRVLYLYWRGEYRDTFSSEAIRCTEVCYVVSFDKRQDGKLYGEPRVRAAGKQNTVS